MRNRLDNHFELYENPSNLIQFKKGMAENIEGVRIGRLLSITQDGNIFVDYPGNIIGPPADSE